MAGEIITGKGLGIALGAKLLYDVCGPTAKYLGGELHSYAKQGIHNLKRVFGIAAQRVKELNKIDGQVPPRVLKEILSEGYFCEDELQACYLGGVLASSKGTISRDDRAVAYCSLVNSLSSYQLRTHCILYTTILHSSKAHFQNISRWMFRHGVTVCIRESDYLRAMDFSKTEQADVIEEHAFIGLEKRGLCEGGLQVIHPHPIRGPSSKRPCEPKREDVPFRYFRPTSLGVELFLWGQGLGDRGINAYSPELLPHLSFAFSITPYDVKFGKVSYG